MTPRRRSQPSPPRPLPGVHPLVLVSRKRNLTSLMMTQRHRMGLTLSMLSSSWPNLRSRPSPLLPPMLLSMLFSRFHRILHNITLPHFLHSNQRLHQHTRHRQYFLYLHPTLHVILMLAREFTAAHARLSFLKLTPHQRACISHRLISRQIMRSPAQRLISRQPAHTPAHFHSLTTPPLRSSLSHCHALIFPRSAHLHRVIHHPRPPPPPSLLHVTSTVIATHQSSAPARSVGLAPLNHACYRRCSDIPAGHLKAHLWPARAHPSLGSIHSQHSHRRRQTVD